MGTWGTGAFENDAGADWLETALAAGLADAVATEIEGRLARKGSRDATRRDNEVRAAAEIVAVAHGAPPEHLESEIAARIAPELAAVRGRAGLLAAAREAFRLVKTAALAQLPPTRRRKPVGGGAATAASLKANIAAVREMARAGTLKVEGPEEAAAWKAWAETPLDELNARVDRMAAGGMTPEEAARWRAALEDQSARLDRAIG